MAPRHRKEWRFIPGEGRASPSTVKRRRAPMVRFFAFMDKHGICPEGWDPDLLEDFVEQRIRSGLKATTLRKIELMAMSLWFKRVGRLDMREYIQDDLDVPRATLQGARALTPEEDQRALWLAARSETLFTPVVICRDAGLRIDEAINVRWTSYERRRGGKNYLHVEPYPDQGWEPKNHRCRAVPVTDRLAEWLEGQWLDREETHSIPQIAVRFNHGEIGRWLAEPRTAWRKLVQVPMEWDRGMGFHVLRKTFATRLRAKGVELERIQEWLGHASVETTRIYIDSSFLGDEDDIELTT